MCRIIETKIEQYIDYMHRIYGETITLQNVICELETHNDFKRCPATIEYNDEIPRQHNSVAFAQPDAGIGWNSYTIYVIPDLKDTPQDLIIVLTHELAHVVFGTFLGIGGTAETHANLFVERLLNIEMEEHQRMINEINTRNGIET